MDQEWISLNEFMRRNKMGYETVIKLMNSGKLEYQKIGKQYKIKVSKDEVLNKQMENLIRRNEELETTLKATVGMIQNVLNNV